MIPTPEQLKELDEHFVICKFEADEVCETCDTPVEDNRIWFEQTDYESGEGNYYCSKCGLERIKDLKEMYEYTPDELPEGPCATCKGEQDWPGCGGPEKECPITKQMSQK